MSLSGTLKWISFLNSALLIPREGSFHYAVECKAEQSYCVHGGTGFSYACCIDGIDGLSLTTFSAHYQTICESGSCNMNKFGVPQLQSMEKFGDTHH